MVTTRGHRILISQLSLPIRASCQCRQVDLLLSDRNGKLGGNGDCGFDLLLPIVEVHVSDIVLWRMHVWVVLIFPVFDLENGGNSLLTEGDLVPSRTADDHSWVQVELVGIDGCAHDLGQSL
jgi:hypothetical protein